MDISLQIEEAKLILENSDTKSAWSEEKENDLLVCLRTLRGLCVNSKSNQDQIRDHHIPQLVTRLLKQWLEDWNQKYYKCVVCATQFLGNLVASNSKSQIVVWNLICPDIVSHLLKLRDPKICEISSMIVYNCLQSCETSLPCFIDNFSDSFLPLLCDSLTIVKDQDWIILCISEHFLSIETFLPIIFTYGSSNCRCNVLDVLIHSLDEETPDHVLDFMTKQFQVQSDLIALSESPETLDNAVLTVKVLEFLCVASSRDGHDRKFLADGNLLSTVVGVLRKVTAAGKSETSGEFGLSQIRSPPVGSVELSDNPVAGFKSSLIRVIGNLCYRCPENQTKVRELGGIELVLEHFNLDDNNPFIQQWSVLAIRNICEGNVENQEVVTAYERLTAAESPILQRPGVALELKPPSVNPEPYT